MGAVGLREVAARANVSAGTVSNFLNHPGRVAPDTAARIRSAINDLGYVGNSAARTLRVGESRTIGHIAFEVGNPFFHDFARGVEERAAEAGYSVLIANSAASAEREASYLDLFESQRARGILLSPVGEVDSRVENLIRRGIPTVLIDRVADTSLCSSISVDDVAGGRMAVEHLLEQGRRRILFVGGPLAIDTVSDRLVGATSAIERVGDAALEVVEVGSRTIATGREIGRLIRERPAENRPDAIFAVNDLLAVGILHGVLEDPAIRIPEDIALVGYDDIDFAADAVVPLTSVRRHGELFGRTALDLLQREIARGDDVRHERVVFQPELVARRSTVG
ncbi:LacI family DNA-binding transcriptional regulator [Microbacterium saperdae]|uniref:LacI family transcriptional regulator n=1 Tax=Microbacterium saperdae TaxID=69368 RepID=A0A543BLC0_9MICO|nr:LacI family DNA-binding transcriptional regulator [Microbacterium saperdae]TQL85629.1 LacI family transcriptional regulator [Microbacterium saperdae]GGM62108.1 LacI family transcriptional regulator [Microbacterium saperdae]